MARSSSPLILALIVGTLAGAPGSHAQRNLTAAPSAAGEQRIALIIGNAAYREAPLRNPVNDATDMAQALRELGFAVTLRTNATHSEMEEAIQQFGLDIRRGGAGLFFFAGHGIQSRGSNYLVPVGAKIKSEADLKFQSVDSGWVLAQMEEARNRVNIVILDACRNNPYARSFRSNSRGLAQMDAARGSFLAFATAPGDVAQDGSGRNGTYTKHLLRSLKEPESDIFQVFSRVSQAVAQETREKQIPWFNSSLTGRFQFRPDGRAAQAVTIAPAAAITEATAVELAFWDSIKTSTASADFEEYLRQYPHGRFAGLAQNRLKRLPPAEPAQVASAVAAIASPAAVAPARPPTTAPTETAARVERPDVKVGNQWKYQITDLHTGERSAAAIKVATVAKGRVYTSGSHDTLATAGAPVASNVAEVWDSSWNLLQQGEVAYKPFYPSFQFPLEIGKRWSGSVSFAIPDGNFARHVLDAQVVGWEQITVPAGTFNAVKIAFRGQLEVPVGGEVVTGTIRDVVWYAPAVGQVVRKEIEHRPGDIRGSARYVMVRHTRYERWELTEFKLD